MSLSQPSLPDFASAPPLRGPNFGRPVHYSGYGREGQDFYATPAWVTEALLQHVRLRGSVWEPCCGDGAMSKVLAEHGHQVVSTDLMERGFGTPGVDFLQCQSVPDQCRTPRAANAATCC